MAALLKWRMKCVSEDCGNTAFILVDPDEESVPNLCAFCGAESKESTGEDKVD